MKLPIGYIAGQGVVKPTGYGGVGERLLRQMGWQDGSGLGKTGDGIKDAIEVKKKEDNAGVRRRKSIPLVKHAAFAPAARLQLRPGLQPRASLD
jgi:hypothetical protein